MTQGERIRELREKKGLTITELAEKSGVSQPFMTGIENDYKSPSGETAVRMAKALDCTTDYIFAGVWCLCPESDQVL